MGVGLWLKLRVAAEQGGKGQDGWCSDLRPPPTPHLPLTGHQGPERPGPVSVSRRPLLTSQVWVIEGSQARLCGFLFENATWEDQI